MLLFSWIRATGACISKHVIGRHRLPTTSPGSVTINHRAAQLTESIHKEQAFLRVPSENNFFSLSEASGCAGIAK